VEGIMREAAQHWDSDSVTNDPLGEPGRTPLYVDLSTWGSVVGDYIFLLFHERDIN